MNDERWEREALRDIAMEGIKERRRARRWGIFFKALFIGYLILLLALTQGWVLAENDAAAGPHAAVVRISGAIMPDGPNRAENIIRGLRNAFENAQSNGVILHVNSPGGSPVQSSLINDEIRRLKELHPDKPFFAVAEDMITSGAYYVAVSADRIFVDRSTMIGSIGVLMNSFGFNEAINKLGVERRLYTSGESKGFLDPFSEEKPEDVAWVQGMLDDIHMNFIDAVKTGRGDRLSDDENLFSGLVWTGQQGIDLGLADEFGSLLQVARDELNTDEIRDYTPQPNVLQALANRLGASVGEKIVSSLTGQPGLR